MHRTGRALAATLVGISMSAALPAISVHGKRPLVDTSLPTATVDFDAEAVERLPTGRNFRDLLTLVPGVVSGQPVDTVKYDFEPRGSRDLVPAYGQPGWEWGSGRNRFTYSGPPLGQPGWIGAGFRQPIGQPPVRRVIVILIARKKVLSQQTVPVMPLNPPIRLSDPMGGIRLPYQISPGDHLEFKPLDWHYTPGGGTWKIGSLTPKWNGSFRNPIYSLDFPLDWGRDESWPLGVSYTDPWGETLIDGPATDVRLRGSEPREMGVRPAITGCTPALLAGNPFCVCGNFPPGSTSDLMLNGRPVDSYLVSSTGSMLNLFLPQEFPAGPITLEAARSSSFDIADTARGVMLHVGAEIDRNLLKVGGHATLTLAVAGTEDPIELRLENTTPNIVSLERGNDQKVLTSGGSRNQATREVSARSPGDFGLRYSLTLDPCPCAGGDG